MKKIYKLQKLNIIPLASFALFSYFAFYFLLCENLFHCSIQSIIKTSHHAALAFHLLVLGLLPVYIATIIFGAGLLSIYFGQIVQKIILGKGLSKKLFKNLFFIL